VGGIGDRESAAGDLSLRYRGEGKDLGLTPLEQVIERLRAVGVPPSERTR
jgi:hypothetical protein